MKRFKLNLTLNFIISLFCAILIFDSAAASTPSKLETSKSPTRIRSDIIDIKRKSQTIYFLQNVVVEKDDSSLLADKMVVLYNQDRPQKEKQRNNENTASEVSQSQGKSSIRRIEATQNVKIFSEEFIGSGDFGFYDPKENIFVLEKNVIVNNGNSIASGDKFIYDLTTKKGRFVGKKDETSIRGNGGDKRVVIVIGDDINEQRKLRKKPNE